MESTYITPPKIFWKYYDLFRRGQLSLEQFSKLSGLSESMLKGYLKNL
jgi:hypothetical protein